MIPIPLDDLRVLRKDFVDRTGLGSNDYRITPCSPWPSELFALFAIGQTKGVEVWLEGGTYHGQTSSVLAKTFPNAAVTTVELNPDTASAAKKRFLEDGLKVEVLVGDGNVELPKLAKAQALTTGVFVDGPKGTFASVLARLLLDKHPNVSFVAMHDMAQSVMGRAVPGRAMLEELGRWEPATRSFWATDDEEYVAWAKDMDEGLRELHITEDARSGWTPYRHFAGGRPPLVMRSYGPTVSFLIREG